MNFKHIRKAILLSVLFFPALVFIGCEKFADNTIGQEVQPDEDQIGLIRLDSFYIETKTLKADSVATDELSVNLLGSINDPVFGQLDVASYLQFRLATENATFPSTGLTVDSVVMYVAYTGGFYGDTNTTVKVNVREIEDDFIKDSVYYSNKALSVKTPLLNFDEIATYQIRPKTSVLVGKDSLPALIRVRLKNELGTSILSAPSSSLSNNTEFLKFFKGVKISVDQVVTPGSGVVAYLNSLSAYSKLAIYYRNTATSDTLQFNLPLNASSSRYTTFSNNYTGTQIETQLNGSANGEQEFYIQSGGGVKGQLFIPGLESLLDSTNLVINKAELILPITPGSNSIYASHDRLGLQIVNPDGTRESLLDQFEGDSFFGGYFSTTDNSYHFTITRYIQAITKGVKKNYGIQVISAGSGVTANRTILAGWNNGTVKPKLIVSYTKP